MTIQLKSEAGKLVQDALRSGKYASPDEVTLAALEALGARIQEDFEPGELEQVLAEGERSIETEGTLDGDEAFAARQRRRQPLRTRSS